MILIQETLDEFGYTPDSLTAGSKKWIKLSCDYCGGIFNSYPQRRNKAHSKFPKDCCKKCTLKKKEEMGIPNPFSTEECKKKIKETCLEKYGVENYTQTEEMKEKSKRTNLKKYGTEFAFSNETVKEKIKQTNLEKYGVENPSSNEEIKEKRKQTCLEKFGTEYYLGSEDVKQKTVEKLGVDNPFRLPEIIQKIKKTNIEKYGVDHRMKIKDVAKANNEKGLQTKIETGQVQIYDGKTVFDWAKITGYSQSRFGVLVNQHGWDKAIKMTPRVSSLEAAMENFLIEENIEYNKQVSIEKSFADFSIRNVLLEVDGLFWHSDKKKDRNYHKNKRTMYIKNGYKPMFFREDEINHKFEIVKSIIRNKLGFLESIGARKCKVVKVDKKEAKKFFIDNHLMGSGGGITYGLKLDDELLSCIQMRRKGESWEVSRFCNKINSSISGAFTRLLSAFEKEFSPSRVFTFIDLRYGDGFYLNELGFTKVSEGLSFKWTDGHKTFGRMKFPKNTGFDFGLFKIFDCGQSKHEKVYK